MNLAMVNEVTVIMNERNHPFTESEKEFVVQFAFKTGDKEHTNKLIDELVQAKDETESQKVIQKYSAMHHIKAQWVEQIENLLVALEMYRIEEEKSINRLADILGAYGIDVSAEEIRKTDSEELKEKVKQEGVF